jgi:DNA-binding GntR family transcriptional regulator
MSDHDIRRPENILIEAGAAQQRDDTKTYAIRNREFHENIAEQSRNSALIEALARAALQVQLCGTIASVSPEFAKRAAYGCDEVIGIQGPRYSARRFSCPRPYQPYAGSDSCTLCR